MNTGELIDRVRLEIHTDLTDEQIVSKFNLLSLQLFREFVFPEQVTIYTTTETPYLALPADCAEDRIRCVIIDDNEYTKVTPEIQNPPANFCTSFLGALYINPVPPAGKEAYLYYRPRPITLSVAALSESPNFPEDYHELYVYDAAKWIAGLARDTDMRNNFQADFDELMKRAKKGLKKMGLKRVKETTIW